MTRRPCPGLTRRDMLRFGSVAVTSSALGNLVPFQSRSRAAGADGNDDPAVILIWLAGGPAQQETFDLKPDAPVEYRGDFKPIDTNVPGVRICEHLPQLARCADKFSLIRSIAHTFQDHGGGSQRFLTGRLPPKDEGVVNHYPMVGSMAIEALRKKATAVPAYLAGVDTNRAGIDTFCFGSAYLGMASHPFMILGDPAGPKFEIPNLAPLPGVSASLPDRLSLLRAFDRGVGPDPRGAAESIDAFRNKALMLLTSERTQRAFDLRLEPSRVRERYGMSTYGQRALLARRLVEHGSTWVTMVLENPTPPVQAQGENGLLWNWDHHGGNCNIFQDTKHKLGYLDRALTALIEDLHERGMQRKVLVVVTGEFGRTPKVETSVTAKPGRGHWPQAMSVLVSGGGLRMGQVVGATGPKADYPKERPLTPNDLWATVFKHLEIDYNTVSFPDETGRPMPMLPDGDPIAELA